MPCSGSCLGWHHPDRASSAQRPSQALPRSWELRPAGSSSRASALASATGTAAVLDQNQWSNLSLALHSEPRAPEDSAAAEAVQRSVAHATASSPLSTAHVFETWQQHRADKRQPLAQAMMEISGNGAIASPQQLLPPELDQALHRRFGRPDPPAEVTPFGRGLKHLSGDVAPDPDPALARDLRELHPELNDAEITDRIDALLLAGPDENLPTAERTSSGGSIRASDLWVICDGSGLPGHCQCLRQHLVDLADRAGGIGDRDMRLDLMQAARPLLDR
jgi:hypothetical protein